MNPRRPINNYELDQEQLNLSNSFSIFHSIPTRKNVHLNPKNSAKLKNLISQRIGHAIDNGQSEVNLSGLQLFEVPPQISELQYFVTFNGQGICSDIELNLSLNNLEVFPKELLSLKNLTVLNLSGNNITFLPSTIDNLVNLRVFSVDNNKLEYLPCSLLKLKKLQIFNASSNPFPALKQSMEATSNNSVVRETTTIHFNPKLCLEEHCLRVLNQLDIRSIANEMHLPAEIEKLLKKKPKDRCSQCTNTFFNSAVDILKLKVFPIRVSSMDVVGVTAGIGGIREYPFLYQFCSFFCKEEYIKINHRDFFTQV
ncbi:hypothetical protein CONCODRAFT_71171 [Conidiobolus coronatus NRRL 28638]|uniref:L domain-like protein n=1 Tax=Conidiobolus coronatus (strain ATCC 28846 / CBS 209.66 / NRRL 28638) TaxID=796925 RepID=A0A137P4A3_CONC2|nr:hypothetical protein CONCODRAFT_71171 [Conidiobolus coronatus NRRL 28638]|eukprot:KXN69823.1 hypothetical protein CONCODRAFT_71171 [Conidiobolus coronatus NRRL 28638]